MLFSHRHAPTWTERLRIALWPRRSFRRSARYVGWRILRLGGNPHGLALGLAAGVFVASLPLLGAQLILAAALAWAIRGNVPAALLGTLWANPITTPLLWLAAYMLGSLALNGAAAPSPGELGERVWLAGQAVFKPGSAPLAAAYAEMQPILLPLALGSVVLGAVSALAFYYACYHLIRAHRTPAAGADSRKPAPRKAVRMAELRHLRPSRQRLRHEPWRRAA